MLIESVSHFEADSREIWEASVIGTLILGEGRNLGLCDLDADDFSVDSFQSVYRAILSLSENGDPIDELTIYNRAGKAGGIAQAISDAVNAVPTHENLEYYLKNLKRHCLAARRAAVQGDVAGRIRTAEDPLLVSEEMTRKISALEEKYSDHRCDEGRNFPGAVDRMMQRIYLGQPADAVLFSGLGFLDRLSRGMMPADNIVLAARPSQGKTALLLQILASVREPSCFFSKEMTEDALAGRLLAHVSGRDTTVAIREPDKLDANDRSFFLGHRSQISAVASKILLFTQGIDMKFVRKKAYEAVAKGAKLIALDYLQLMETKGRSRNEEIELISREWKNLLKELMVPGILLSQLSRECERDNRRPRLSDLRDGGAIEQDADTVWFLHREKVNPKDKRPNAPEQTVLIQEKGRNTGRGIATLNFNGRSQTFFQMEKEEES